MEIDLVAAAPLPEPAWPDGITVRTADPENLERDARLLHAAETESFSDHYGYTPSAVRGVVALPHPVLRAGAGAVDPGDGWRGGRGHGALLPRSAPGQPDLGWVSTLGVRRPWRRRGLALAILHASFRLLAARGKARVGLGVDSQSLTGATRLYEKAGMRVVRESTSTSARPRRAATCAPRERSRP